MDSECEDDEKCCMSVACGYKTCIQKGEGTNFYHSRPVTTIIIITIILEQYI